MVGSRYHELIDSADSIVSMKEISTEVLDLLQGFPQACSSVLNQVTANENMRLTCLMTPTDAYSFRVRLPTCFRPPWLFGCYPGWHDQVSQKSRELHVFRPVYCTNALTSPSRTKAYEQSNYFFRDRHF